MKPFLGKDTKVMVRGITGHQGSFHTKRMLAYGTKIVCGVTPGKGGSEFEGVPVYNSAKEAVKKHKVDASIVFVPAAFTLTAVTEDLEAGIRKIVIITEGIPIHDMLKIKHLARIKKAVIIGPNCPGVIVPGEILLGIMSPSIFLPGDIPVISRSGTLTYEIVAALTENGLGQKICIGIGGDAISGVDFIQASKLVGDFKRLVIVGEIGGRKEEEFASKVKKGFLKGKKIYALLAGRTAPKGKRMGHAGAIIEGNVGTYESKFSALTDAGVRVASTLEELVGFVSKGA